MDRFLYYKMEESDTRASSGGKVELVLRRRFRLTANEISRLKFTAGGIMALRGKKADERWEQVRVSDCLAAGDTLRVCLRGDDSTSDQVVPVSAPLSILYEDTDIIIVNKPSGVVTHPAHGHYTDTMANYLAGLYKERGEDIVCRVIGRLDKDTSGALVWAKNRYAAARLKGSADAVKSEEAAFEREYLALAAGHFEEKSGVITESIGKIPGSLNRQEIRSDGKSAVTRYQVLDEARIKGTCEIATLLRVRIETGRSHQIRVHMAGMGHPLLGDALYNAVSENSGFCRAALHSYKVTLKKPFSEEWITITAPLPEDFAEALKGFDFRANTLKESQ